MNPPCWDYIYFTIFSGISPALTSPPPQRYLSIPSLIGSDPNRSIKEPYLLLAAAY